MIVYTPDEVYQLLADVTCKEDLIEITEYIAVHSDHYTSFDRIFFAESLQLYYEIFNA